MASYRRGLVVQADRAGVRPRMANRLAVEMGGPLAGWEYQRARVSIQTESVRCRRPMNCQNYVEPDRVCETDSLYEVWVGQEPGLGWGRLIMVTTMVTTATRL
jgi:hypothetical protein